MKTPPRCATWLILAMVLQLHWFKIMFLGALKVVREKFAKNDNSNSLRNNSDSNQEDHSTNETTIVKNSSLLLSLSQLKFFLEISSIIKQK